MNGARPRVAKVVTNQMAENKQSVALIPISTLLEMGLRTSAQDERILLGCGSDGDMRGQYGDLASLTVLISSDLQGRQRSKPERGNI